VDFQNFVTHLLDEVFSQDMVNVDNLFFLGDAQVALGILSSCVACQPSYFTWTIPSSSFLSRLVNFDKRVM
jgi:hypothetical protein